ncbi:DM13 domain-containing protein [Endozoicomonas numazuensis]|uniref:Phenylalanine--tRNA ligase n=1 Tax=Endozoicomonas numazuensis TaxID=1137799 RepID=A0A081NKV3_9GAMM|nr:DM13 domain-containing protein [Endozoicomonas numazuensis]KEQ19076.1 phenylalanine--tRNA ligase [Endozoicomonas numazuensis]
MKKCIVLLISHALALAIGFAGGIYALPILTAPLAPETAVIETKAKKAKFSGEFRRNLKDSDSLHWGEGKVFVGKDAISLMGELAPGPDYKLYLSPEFIDNEQDFERLKPKMVQVGDVKTFKNFIVPVPSNINIKSYNTVIIWCESFGQFITAARYR